MNDDEAQITPEAVQTDEASPPTPPGVDDGEPRYVEIERDAVSGIIAETVIVRQGAIQRIDANEVEVKQAAVLFARAENLDIAQAGVMGAFAREVSLELSAARLVAARENVHLEQSAALAVVGNHVEVAPNAAVGVLIARTVEGDVRPLFDWRAAAAFGAVAGLVYAAAWIAFRRRG